MNLYLLRHGLAVEPGSPGYATDADRPLTAEGERKMERIAEAMKALELSFDLILSSPYLRARQTAEIVAKTLKARKRLELADVLTPAHGPERVVAHLKSLAPTPQDALLVGHEPGLSELISFLVGGGADLAITMKKGGLCKLAAEPLTAGHCASLEWLLTPKQMLLMAES
jgi:phosphohistidine phosphatase